LSTALALAAGCSALALPVDALAVVGRRASGADILARDLANGVGNQDFADAIFT
jgi:hypothetical protein